MKLSSLHIKKRRIYLISFGIVLVICGVILGSVFTMNIKNTKADISVDNPNQSSNQPAPTLDPNSNNAKIDNPSPQSSGDVKVNSNPTSGPQQSVQGASTTNPSSDTTQQSPVACHQVCSCQ